MRELINRVAHIFKSTEAHLTADRHLLFLCGGSDAASLRKQFMNYATISLPSFRVFLGESAAQDLTDFGPPTFINLSQFEQFIAAFADCVVIFLESAGSLAEIGLFSNEPSIRRKLLVVNDLSYQTQNSFINNGPLAEVNASSVLRPVIHMDPGVVPVNFAPIRERLLPKFSPKYRRRFVFATYNSLQPPARLGIVLALVELFSPLSFDDIFLLINEIFGNADEEEIKHLLSLAVAVGYVQRVGDLDDLFCLDPTAKPLIEFRRSDETERVRIAVLTLYREHFRELYDLLSTPAP